MLLNLRPMSLLARCGRVLVTSVVLSGAVALHAQAPAPAAASNEPPPATPTAPSLEARLEAARQAVEQAKATGDEAKIRLAASLVDILDATIAAETKRIGFQRAIETAETDRTDAEKRLAAA